jgi:hypothetical protein
MHDGKNHKAQLQIGAHFIATNLYNRYVKTTLLSCSEKYALQLTIGTTGPDDIYFTRPGKKTLPDRSA